MIEMASTLELLSSNRTSINNSTWGSPPIPDRDSNSTVGRNTEDTHLNELPKEPQSCKIKEKTGPSDCESIYWPKSQRDYNTKSNWNQTQHYTKSWYPKTHCLSSQKWKRYPFQWLSKSQHRNTRKKQSKMPPPEVHNPIVRFQKHWRQIKYQVI